MEDRTSFDLNLALQGWRENLEQSPAFRSENLDELETHLRDSVAALQDRGLSEEEAFLVATRRIGKRAELEPEFARMNVHHVWLDRMFWTLIGVQMWSFASNLIGSRTDGAVSFGFVTGKYDFHAHGLTIPLTLFILSRLIATAGSLALCWWLMVRKGAALGSRIQRQLRRPVNIGMVLIVFSLLSWVTKFLKIASSLIVARPSDNLGLQTVVTASTFATVFEGLFMSVLLLVITVMMARKRLRLSRV